MFVLFSCLAQRSIGVDMMHMADALITPLVGGVMYIATARTAQVSIRNIRDELNDTKIPLMGVMGAFVFTAQMINFSIPGTGSSGHLGGGMLLAALLGPYGGFLTMAAILTIQALFFADGGLLALGCNIFNLGFYTCFVAYPLIYKRMLMKGYSTVRIISVSMLASIIGLQLGAFSVVVETMASGKLELPFGAFALLMQLIHLAIGIVEGLITAAVINFIWKARPELLEGAAQANTGYNISLKKVMTVFVIAALIIGGILSWYASSNPDGLEWSLYTAAGREKPGSNGVLQQKLIDLQEKTAILPDYGYKQVSSMPDKAAPPAQVQTSVSGITGGLLSLLVIILAGWIIRFFVKKEDKRNWLNDKPDSDIL